MFYGMFYGVFYGMFYGVFYGMFYGWDVLWVGCSMDDTLPDIPIDNNTIIGIEAKELKLGK